MVGLAALCGALGAGCMYGPKSLQISHGQYNRAIRQTTDEQLLLNLVRLQYREAPTFLDVTSVSAQFVISERAGLTATINEGPGRINPDVLGASATLSYDERPTITFAPLEGKEFVNRMLTPLPLEVVALLTRSGWRVDRVLRLTVQGMNGLDNAASASGPTPASAPHYEALTRVTRLLRALQRDGLLELGYETLSEPITPPLPTASLTADQAAKAAAEGYGLQLSEDGEHFVLTGSRQVLVWRIPPAAADRPEVSEIVSLLGLAPGRSRYEIRLAGATLSAHPEEAGARTVIHISTRSLLGSLFFLSQGVEVPPPHRRAGVVTRTVDAQGQPFDWSQVTGGLLAVRVSRTPPLRAAVTVRYRGYWYYIDDADLDSKSTFALLGQLFALQAGGAEKIMPVLTLPVGG